MMEIVRLLQPDDYVPQERSALITYELMIGREMTTQEIAERVGITRQAANVMMSRVVRVVPGVTIVDGRWLRLE
jgi:hypothetical protein